MQRSKPVPNSPSRSVIRHGSWPPRWTAASATGKAVECAEVALKRSPGKQPEYWDTLAAAQAEAGKFKEAVDGGGKSPPTGPATGADDLIPGIQQRLELFKSGRPYHAEAQHPQRM